jgi:hypothetical protein
VHCFYIVRKIGAELAHAPAPLSYGRGAGGEVKTHSNNSGFTVYIVLTILSIAMFMISVFLIRMNAVQKFSSAEVKKIQVYHLAQSGVERASYFLSGGDNHTIDWECENYAEKIGDYGLITLQNRKFGVFAKLTSTGRRLDYTCTYQNIFGRTLPELLDPVITLTGHSGGLELKDGSTLSGPVVLFHGGIRYYQSPVIIKVSPSLPFDSTAVYKTVQKINSECIALLANRNCITSDFVINESTDLTKYGDTIVVLGNLEISGREIENKLIIVSGTATLDRNAALRMTMLFCETAQVNDARVLHSVVYTQKKCLLRSGMYNAQCITNDSLVIKKDMSFGSLSVCVNYRSTVNDTIVSGGVYLDENVNYHGVIISVMDSLAKKRCWYPSITLNRNASVNGILVTNQSIYMKENSVKGHIWAQQIESSDKNVAYTNYLIGCTIQPSEINMPFPLFGPSPFRLLTDQATEAHYQHVLRDTE